MESFIRTMIFYPHFETVDVLNILSIIKHYAKDFEITLVVIKFNLENIKLLMLDIPNIKDKKIREFILENPAFFKPVYPIPMAIVYKIYFNSGCNHCCT